MTHRTTVRSSRHQWLTVEELCEELHVSRRTWDRWRAKGTGPRAKRLAGNGPIRIRRDWLDEWVEAQEDA